MTRNLMAAAALSLLVAGPALAKCNWHKPKSKTEVCLQHPVKGYHVIKVPQHAANFIIKHVPGALLASEWSPDADGDSYGDPAGAIRKCPAPGYVDNTGDCNDADAGINPEAEEVCDGKDNSCSSIVDAGFPDFDGDTLKDCVDPDDDGDGDPDATDCAAFNAFIYHGAPEVCDGIDNSCSGIVDAGFPDFDGDNLKDCVDPDDDGDGDPDTADCAAFDQLVYHGAAEVCGDGIDQNCNAEADEGCVVCPCFDGDELDAIQADWVAEAWTDSTTRCTDVIATAYSYTLVEWTGQRYGSASANESTTYYAIKYNPAGAAYCSRYHKRNVYDPATGSWSQTEFEDTFKPISALEDAECRDVVYDFAERVGLVCGP